MTRTKIVLHGMGGHLKFRTWPTTRVDVHSTPMRGVVVHADTEDPCLLTVTHEKSGAALVRGVYAGDLPAVINILARHTNWRMDGMDLIRVPGIVRIIEEACQVGKFKNRGRQQEEISTKMLGAELVPGSGALPGGFRDAVMPRYLIEQKHPDPGTPRHRVVVQDLTALFVEASMSGKTPCYMCVWRDVPHESGEGFVLVPAESVYLEEFDVIAEHLLFDTKSMDVRRTTAATLCGNKAILLDTDAGTWLMQGWGAFLMDTRSE